jgi:DNA polymerase-3 subunit beta
VKIRLERDVLAEAVQWAARSLPLRPSVPILAGLLVHADAEGVTFSVSTTRRGSIHVTAAAGEGQGPLWSVAGNSWMLAPQPLKLR